MQVFCMITLHYPTSKIVKVEIETSPYQTSLIRLYHASNEDAQASLDALQKYVEAQHADINNIHTHAGVITAKAVIPENLLRAIIDELFENKRITASQRADIENDLRMAEGHLAYAQLSGSTLTQAQQDMLHEMLSPYVDAVAEVSEDYKLVCTLFEHIFAKNFSNEKNNVLKLIHNSGQSTEFCRTLMDCLKALNRICWGKANLESIFTKLGASVPNLTTQRMIAANFCLDALFGRFNTLSIDTRFDCAAKLFIMVDEKQHRIYPGHNDKILANILAEKITNTDSFFTFAAFNGAHAMIAKVVEKVCVTQDAQESLKALKNSAVLDATIATLTPLQTLSPALSTSNLAALSLFSRNANADSSDAECHSLQTLNAQNLN